MLFRPVARRRAGLLTVEPCVAICGRGLFAVALLGFAGAAVPAHADLSASEIIAKMNAIYSTAKSFKGSTIMQSSGKGPDGKPFTVTATQQVAYKSPNQFRVQVTASGTGAASKASGNSQTVVSDGKTMYMYLPARKQYIKRPAPPQVPIQRIVQINVNGQNAKLMPASTVNGRPAYIVQIMPMLPPTLTAQQKQLVKPSLIAVDKQNFHLLRITQGGNAQVMTFTGQTVNGNLPASVFAFSPPAGATEFKQPMPGAPGGAPGAPPVPPGSPR